VKAVCALLSNGTTVQLTPVLRTSLAALLKDGFRGNQHTVAVKAGDVFSHPVTDMPADVKPGEELNLRVPLSSLVPTQSTLVQSRIDDKKGKSNPPIKVVRDGDKYLVQNGHHRAAAAIQSGGGSTIEAVQVGTVSASKVLGQHVSVGPKQNTGLKRFLLTALSEDAS
jgi:hypothetical protein